MADIGQIVTNEEVVQFIPGLKDVGLGATSPLALTIVAVEAAVQGYCKSISGLNLAVQTYTDEEISIEPGALYWDCFPIKKRTTFRLRNRPVTEFTSLKYVQTRKESDGTPDTTSTVVRNTYHVDLRTAIVTLLKPLCLDPSLAWDSWPEGTAILLATYKAGFNLTVALTTAQFAALKMAILQIISRMTKLRTADAWALNASQSDFGTTAYYRKMFTEEEMLFLQAFALLMGQTT